MGAQRPHHAVTVADVDWLDADRGRTVPVRIYYPSDEGRKFPVIVFSTGLGRSRDDCGYLGRHWAGCGYVGIFVQHPGSDEQARQGTLRRKKNLQKAFYAPSNIRNRPLDLIFAIDQLERLAREGHASAQRCDLSRIGAAGHDFGAQTALALAGAVLPGDIVVADRRVKAVVAMSSPVPLGQLPLDLAFGPIAIPCLHITGTADNSIVGTTTAAQRRLPFDYAQSADAYLVTLFGADHLTVPGHARPANAGSDAAFHRLIAQISTAFWDACLAGDAAAKTWLADGGLSDMVGPAGRVEEKLCGPSAK
jgi:predicted dienelactone hydrolase